MIKFLKAVYRILWGKTYYRFSASLLIIGGGLLAAPQWWEYAFYFLNWAFPLVVSLPQSGEAYPGTLVPQIAGGCLLLAAIGNFFYFAGEDQKRNWGLTADSEGKACFRIPDNWRFEDVARYLALADAKLIKFSGFAKMERHARMKELELEASSIISALQNLSGALKKPGNWRYTVNLVDDRYVLEKEK